MKSVECRVNRLEKGDENVSLKTPVAGGGGVYHLYENIFTKGSTL